MPQVSARTSIAATSTVNVMSGLLFERVGGRGAAIRAYIRVVTATGAADITATLIAGSDVLTQDAAGFAEGEGVIVPDDQIASGVGLPGDQILLNISNANAAARVVAWRVDIENA